jgi:superfamily II DNA or RNA helicase
MLELRDYQRTCVDLVVQSYEQNPQGEEYLVLPCGAGKTIIFSAIIHTLARVHNCAALILAHRDELLDQAIEKYQYVDSSAIIGKVGGGVHNYGGDVTVGSIATVSRPKHIKNLKALYGTGQGLIIVIDEFHHSQSDGYQRVIKAFPDAFLLGVTATPDRLDRKLLLDGKPPLFQMSIIDMIKRKYLCDMRVIAIRTETSLDDIHTQMGDFNEKELDLAINTPDRNKRIVDAYQEYAAGKRTICFAVTVAHARALEYAFNDAGIPAATITGNTSIDERKKLYAQLRSGEILVLTSVMVLSEGFDETSVECVIMARPTQSRGLFVQCIGRGVRLHPGKKEAIILDITDNCLKHRLMPVNLRKALDMMNLKDDETIEEALAREKEELEEREKQAMVRKLKEKRVKDLQIDLLTSIAWTEHAEGHYSIELPRIKHKLGIIPVKGTDMYYVAAKIHPTNTYQKWTGNQSLEACQQWAEEAALRLLADPSTINLYDTSHPWKQKPISDGQKKMLRWYRIPFSDEMTSGEASRIIDAHQKEIAKRKAAAAARKAQREALG